MSGVCNLSLKSASPYFFVPRDTWYQKKVQFMRCFELHHSFDACLFHSVSQVDK